VNPMTLVPEVFAVAATVDGLWLLDEDAWRCPLPVMVGSDPYEEVKLELHGHGALDDLLWLHETSGHVDGPRYVLTHLAAIHCPDSEVLERWPRAIPITRAALVIAGDPPDHGPIDLPDVRHFDVLLHGLRLAVWELRTNDHTAAVLGPTHWPVHLEPLEPALARMYRRNATPV
jgi:hypothetical protein